MNFSSVRIQLQFKEPTVCVKFVKEMPRILELGLIFCNCILGGQQCDQTFAGGTL